MTSKLCLSLILLLGVGSLPLGCGDDSESQSATGGNAGTSSSQAGKSGASSDGGASASNAGASHVENAGAQGGGAPSTQPDECADYAATYCSALSECAPRRITRDYEDEENCVDVLSARCASEEERGFPIADMAGCIETLNAGDCDDVLSDLSGACKHERGSKAAGEPCIDNGECNSGICRFSGTQCGECTEVAALGDPCDVSGLSCTAPGLTCDYEAEECAAIEIVGVGEVCDGSSVVLCEPNLVCSGGECAETLQEGDDCSLDPNRCDPRRELNCTDNECVPFVVMNLGDACGADWPFPRCSDYAYCDPEMLECVPRHGLNEDCADDPVAGSTCLPGMSCVDGTCVDATAGCLN